MSLGSSIGSSGSSPTDLDIRNLSRTQDNILIYANTAADGTGTNLVPLVDAAGNLQVDILTLPQVVISGLSSVDTELPAAGVLADNMANPSTPLVGSCLLAWDTATWDRVQIGTGTAAASLRVTVATDVGLPAGTNNIGDVDVLSVIPGTAATNLGKAEDAVHVTGDTGVFMLGVRQAANAPLSGTDGDYEPLQLDANGHVKVNVIDALPAGTNNIGDVDVLSVIPGTAATNLGKAEDAAHVSGDTGVMALSVRQDTAAALAGTDADYQPLISDANGRQHVTNVASYISSATYSPSRFADLGANATLNVKATAGNVFSVWCHNENAAVRYIQLHNTATTPAGGATPLFTFEIPATGQIIIGTDFFTDAGARFSTGIAFAFSSTKDTYTAGTSTEQSTIVMFA